jgi:hypothetical protein
MSFVIDINTAVKLHETLYGKEVPEEVSALLDRIASRADVAVDSKNNVLRDIISLGNFGQSAVCNYFYNNYGIDVFDNIDKCIEECPGTKRDPKDNCSDVVAKDIFRRMEKLMERRES